MNVVEFNGVAKRFTLHHERARSFQELFISVFRRNGSKETFWALDDVSFVVAAGESVGIIGENGSGKSTTLKLITRILQPTRGSIRVNGKISALLELGAGFHPELTGRENIYLNGSLLGFSKRRMDDKYREIVDFAELERFIDTPLKHYSSGMIMRLGFAIAISAEPDILITDEVLAVGDESFQRKCLDKIWEFKKHGKTIVFVSHGLSTVRDLCQRAIWLHQGKLKADGPARQVVDDYLEAAYVKYQAQIGEKDAPPAVVNRWGTFEAEITGVSFLDGTGRERSVFETGDTLVARLRYVAHSRIERPLFGVAIHRNDGTHINGPNTRDSGYPIDYLEGEGEIDFIIDRLPLLDGTYEFTAAIYDRDGTHPYDHHHRMYTFQVWRGRVVEKEGTFYIPCRWNLHSLVASGAR